MAISPIGLAALKAREGVRLKAYQDSVGVWTIGYGHTLGVKSGQTITQDQADAFLLADLAAHDVTAFVTVPLADHEADALISVAFNIGLDGAKTSTFLRVLNQGDRAACAAAIMLWKKPAEIISRRTAERDQFLTPYGTALPKARSTDAKPVAAPVPEPTASKVADPAATTTITGSLISAIVAKQAEVDQRITAAVSELDAIREAQAALQSDINGLG